MNDEAIKALKTLYSELHDEMHKIARQIPWELRNANLGFYCRGKVNAIAKIRGKIYQIIRDSEKKG